jgi:hypothetical protein
MHGAVGAGFTRIRSLSHALNGYIHPLNTIVPMYRFTEVRARRACPPEGWNGNRQLLLWIIVVTL